MIYLILAVVGLAFGSFVNAFVWRWRQQEQEGRKKAKGRKPGEFSIVHGRSMCPECRHELAAKDLLPVLSWLWLRGKCRYCHKPISVQYPLVELSTAALFVLSYVFWPVGFNGTEIAVFSLWLAILVGLIILAVYDMHWQLLPDKIVLGVSVIAIIQAIVRIAAADKPLTALANIVFAVIVGGGIFYILFQASKGRWIGGGDVKLGLLLGLLVATPGRSFLLLFLASLLGTVLSLPQLWSKQLSRTSRIAFGPFLILAAIIVVLFGHDIISWYQATFLPGTIRS
jgi:prepilin signal peptidase PulO-like enzyme (type II secretory pathway)